MALITCHDCGKQYSDEAASCVHCGAANKSYVKPESGCLKAVGWLMLAVVVLLMLFLGFGAMVSSTPEGRERAQARNAIDYCEREYEKISRDPRMSGGAAGIAYGACEKLKQDFRNRWGREP